MRQRTLWKLAPAAVLVLACRQGAPERGDAAAESQADLVADSAQARLWREAAARSPLDMEALRLDSAVVRPAARQPVPERAAPEQPARPFHQSVDAALVLVEAPAVDPPYSGPARVTVAGEYVSLDIGDGRTIRLHIKVAGNPLRAQTGEQGQLFFAHHGDPFVATDRLALRLPQDDLLYALVGDTSLVRLALPPFRLTAQQIEPIENNTTPVRVTVGGETRTMRHGETAAFRTGNLTVRVLASVAVRGEAAHALPGEPFRLHLLGWRTRPER
ncbi:MAG: hypothetical protein M3373_12225 [Gemmatimonadota bacterium]|nr:hypothetical protein [Gemmatimonadota bacterium]